MTFNGRSSRWGAALALGFACLVGVSAATVTAAPARTAASAFELTFETTFGGSEEWPSFSERFRSRAPFCEKGTVEHIVASRRTGDATRFTCDDGTGSLTVLMRITTWQILDGSGSYAGLRGRGWVRYEPPEIWDAAVTYRRTLGGVADLDAIPPTIAFSSATATKLRAGAYAIKVALALRDNVDDNPVSYTLRVSAGGTELARRFGTARTEAVSATLRIRPPAGARTVRLQLTGEDPVGNAVAARRALSLPR